LARPGRREQRKREKQRQRPKKPVTVFAPVERVQNAIREEMVANNYTPIEGASLETFIDAASTTVSKIIRVTEARYRTAHQFSEHEKNWLAGRTVLPRPNQPLILTAEVEKLGQRMMLTISLYPSGRISFKAEPKIKPV